jgi:DNA (cytosine-5)-methyltransferase 1
VRAFYNEISAYCCDWLSNLMDAGHITPGVICDRSIEDIFPDELIGFERVHMFAGIGTWDYALNLAGWGESEVWTGSAPCQPFSEAGKGLGFADDRHLWPAFNWLIQERRPSVVFGEQVAKLAIEPWIDLVQTDLERMGYGFGAVPFPSASVGSPQNRERVYWMADSDNAERRTEEPTRYFADRPAPQRDQGNRDAWKRLHGPDWKAFAASFCTDVDGDKTRLARLRAIGNTINAEQAAEFIRAAIETIDA